MQAIVAAETHRRLDPNHDGIDREELETELKTFLDPHIAKVSCATPCHVSVTPSPTRTYLQGEFCHATDSFLGPHISLR